MASPKRKNSPGNRAAGLSLLALLMGVVLGAAVMTALILPSGSDLFNLGGTIDALNAQLTHLPGTQSALNTRQAANDATQNALRNAATSDALNARATELALNNARDALNLTATQSDAFLRATRTAQAALNARQQTQIALNQAATRAALAGNATQVELDFQATRAALTGDTSDTSDAVATITPTAQSFTTATSPPTVTHSPTLTLTPTGTPTPTLTPIVEGFSATFAFDTQWEVDAAAWRSIEGALFAMQNEALITWRPGLEEAFRVRITLTPLDGQRAAYRLRLGEAAFLLDVSADLIERLRLYRMTADATLRDMPEAGVLIFEEVLGYPLGERLTLDVRVTGVGERSRLNVVFVGADETYPLWLTWPGPLNLHPVGAMLPAGAQLNRLQIR